MTILTLVLFLLALGSSSMAGYSFARMQQSKHNLKVLYKVKEDRDNEEELTEARCEYYMGILEGIDRMTE